MQCKDNQDTCSECKQLVQVWSLSKRLSSSLNRTLALYRSVMCSICSVRNHIEQIEGYSDQMCAKTRLMEFGIAIGKVT